MLPHSNEMLLVRIDPSKPTISMLSIPRELRVPFTRLNGQLEENRINSAYTFGYEESGESTSGGVKLMVETLKQVIGITPNLVFVTNFKRFKRAVDEMGCVYMTVDKPYHHVNEPGGEQYFEINLQPGYQRLCGQEALEFVANRHESTSLIRDARDQRFLLDVKAQYGPTLFENREKFERIVGKAVETDLHSEAQVLQLLELLVESAGKPVRQVPFHVQLHSTYDTATPREIEEAAHSFLRGTAAIAPHRLHGSGGHHHSAHAHPAPPPPPLSLSPTPGSTLAQARTIAPRLPFAVQVPRLQETTAESEPDVVRRYDIAGSGRRLYPAYVVVVDEGELGQYYDIQGSTWTGSPLLSDPNQEVQVGSRTYSLFYDGEHLKTIAWREGSAAYWIENTLTNNLSPQQMLAIAESTRPVIGTATAGSHTRHPPQLQTTAARGPPGEHARQNRRAARLRRAARRRAVGLLGARPPARAAGAARAGGAGDGAGSPPAHAGQVSRRGRGGCRSSGVDPDHPPGGPRLTRRRYAPSRLCTTRSISLIPMNGAIRPPRP